MIGFLPGAETAASQRPLSKPDPRQIAGRITSVGFIATIPQRKF